MSNSLGLILLRAGLITPADLIEAHNGRHDEPLARRLVGLGVVTEEQIAHAFADELHVPNVRVGGAMIEPEAIRIVPRALAEQYVICPYLLDGDRLHLVMANPLDFSAIDAVEQAAGIQVRAAVSTPSDIRATIARVYEGLIDVARRLVQDTMTAAPTGTHVPAREPLTLARLGFEPEQLRLLRGGLEEPQGVILVAGPRGTGKTSTLYAALSHLRCPGIRIVSVEERIEGRIKGVEQREIDRWSGDTSATKLATTVHEGPDVVMVGDVTERDTATVALEAGGRGQLVLAGVQASDTISTLERILELGVDRSLLASRTTLLLAQRLVRRLCPRCREAYQPTHDLAVCLGLPAGMPAFRAKGCFRCDGTGYRGLVAIFEVLPIDPALRELLRRGAAPAVLAREARAAGFVSLQQAAAMKVLQGVTSPEEVFGVMQLDARDDGQPVAAPYRADAFPPPPIVHGASRHAHKRRRMQAFGVVDVLAVLAMAGVLVAAAINGYATRTQALAGSAAQPPRAVQSASQAR